LKLRALQKQGFFHFYFILNLKILNYSKIEGDCMSYEILTPKGLFEVIQSLSYGDMLIASILTLILLVVGFKVLYDIADREGFI